MSEHLPEEDVLEGETLDPAESSRRAQDELPRQGEVIGMSEGRAAEEVHDGVNPLLLEQRVRERAWEVSHRPDAGSPEENWRRAEEEIRQERSGH